MKQRSGITLVEVLVSILIMGIGMIALLTLFPLGAMNIVVALRDDRAAQAGVNANAIALAKDLRHDSAITSGFEKELDDLVPAYKSVGPSSPLYVDPFGTHAGAGRLGAPNGPGVRRVSPAYVENDPILADGSTSTTRTLYWFSLLDDMNFDADGTATKDAGKALERGGRFTWAYLLRRARADSDAIIEMSVVVYSNRPATGTSGETSYAATGQVGQTALMINYAAQGQSKPLLKPGGWIMDASQDPTGVVRGYFYRVTDIQDAGSGTIVLELENPLKIGPNVAPTSAPSTWSIVVLENVVEVFERDWLAAVTMVFGRLQIMPRRSGFTLVELLVSMALILFIMSILSTAFVAASKAVRDLKASADLAERLRQVSGMLRRDLAADHFEAKKRLSRSDFWNDGPPKQGFFRLYQGSPIGSASYIRDGVDPAELLIADPMKRLLDSNRATDHALHFTVKLRGNNPGDYFSAVIPDATLPLFQTANLSLAEQARRYMDTPNLFTSQWAEVVYFLRPTGDTAGGTPLFGLHRRQFLAVDDIGGLAGALNRSQAQTVQECEISVRRAGGALYCNTPRDLTMPKRRLAMVGGSYPVQTDQQGQPTGADVLMTDVISMEMRLLLADGAHFESLYDICGVGANNPRRINDMKYVYPNGNVAFDPPGPLVFDTWSGAADRSDDYTTWNKVGAVQHIPLFMRTDGKTISIQAVQIVLRVWDFKTEKTRQITIVQAL